VSTTEFILKTFRTGLNRLFCNFSALLIKIKCFEYVTNPVCQDLIIFLGTAAPFLAGFYSQPDLFH